MTTEGFKKTFIAFVSTLAVLFALTMLFAIATGGL